MKQLILAALLVLGSPGLAWAQDTAEEPEVQSNGSVQVDDEEGISITFSSDKEERRAEQERLKDEIKTNVLKIVDAAVKAEGEELSDEDRRTIVELLEKSNVDHSSDFGLEALGGLAVGALAIVMIFGMPVFIVIAVLYATYRKKRLVHETINQYLASGKEIPPEVMQELHKETSASPKSMLHKGLIMVGIGLGVLFAFMAIGASAAAFLGFIPLFIGLAQILIWKMEKNGDGQKA